MYVYNNYIDNVINPRRRKMKAPKMTAEQQAIYDKKQAAFSALNKSLGVDIFSFPAGHAQKFAQAYSADKSVDQVIESYKSI
jgi:hypothetical protein